MEQRIAVKSSMSTAAPPASPFAPIGKRIAAIRRAYGVTQTEMARRINVRQNTLSEFEKGSKRIGIDACLMMCDAYDVTLDFIYRGDHSGLSLRLAEAIRYSRRLNSKSL